MFHATRGCSWSLLAAALLALASNKAGATILTFDVGDNQHAILGELENPAYHADYGSNVTSTTAISSALNGPYTYTYGVGAEGFTPNISVSYSHQASLNGDQGNSSYFFSGNGGFLGTVDYLHFSDALNYWITFTPSAGHAVQVNSFLLEMANLTAFPSLQGLTPVVSWALLENNTSGPVLASGTQTLSYPPANDSVTVTTGAASYNGPLVLQISFTGADNQGLVALDNVNFGQSIATPEPATGVLFGLGALGLLFHLRGRRVRA